MAEWKYGRCGPNCFYPDCDCKPEWHERPSVSMDKEMREALRADAEKLRQLTGEDHTPEFLFDCEACSGQGYTARTVQVYEAGCGFSHPDVEEVRCEACNGNGWFVGEIEGDR